MTRRAGSAYKAEMSDLPSADSGSPPAASLTDPASPPRLAALRRMAVLDTPAEADFDGIVSYVSRVLEVPIALISLVEADRQWFKAETGLGRRETPIEMSICARAMGEGGLVEIPDTTLDPRSRDNPLCLGDDPLRFYAGAPLVDGEGAVLGMLCVLDRVPRRLTALQRETLRIMAVQVTRQMELRSTLARLETMRREVDHRVKNSLAAIASVVRMQASRSRSDDVRAALDAVGGRLGAQIALHAQLAHGDREDEGDLAEFVARMEGPLGGLVPDGVVLDVSVAPLVLSGERLGRIGLILNEVVTNAARHAFTGREAGAVRIEGWHAGEAYRLVIRDDGVADAAALAAVRDSTGLGGRIIKASAMSLGSAANWTLASPGLALELTLAA